MTTPDRNARLAGWDDRTRAVYHILCAADALRPAHYWPVADIVMALSGVTVAMDLPRYRSDATRIILRRLDEAGLVERGWLQGFHGRTVAGYRVKA